MTQDNALFLGLDFGSDSVRALLVRGKDGGELAEGVSPYPRWIRGEFCDPVENRFRQHPLDYLESMQDAVSQCLAKVAGSARLIRGIGVDATGSTPVFADAQGQPLALTAEFSSDPDACFILWKDHCATTEAAEINTLARSWGGRDYTAFVGGIYSSEWFWAKAAYILKRNPRVAKAAVTLVEHCDWIPALLAGVKSHKDIRRSRCAAGHKAMWHQAFNGYPSDEFLARIHPGLPALAASLGQDTWTSDHPAGTLSSEWAGKLRLPPGIPVAVGAFDAHMGAVGAGLEAGTFLRIMGTSTCDIMVKPHSPGDTEHLVPGICGQVDGSVIPGMLGLEAGQSAYGDIFAWFRRTLAWPLEKAAGLGLDSELSARIDQAIIPWLDQEASKMPAGGTGVLALDWFNGRRTPDADQTLRSAISGLTLGSSPPAIYRALVEAAAYGSRAIVDRMRQEGVEVKEVGAIGGVARKSHLVMQVLSDVLDMAISVRKSDQCCALGAAVFAAVAAGLYPDTHTAMQAMASPVERVYEPRPKEVAVYKKLYKDYLALAGFIQTQKESGK